MTIDRRDLLLGGAGAGAMLALDASPLRAAAVGARADDLPMPPPTHRLPSPLPVADPTRTRLDAGWLFHLGDIAMPPVDGHNSYDRTKAGNAAGAAATDYDDSDWRTVAVPHDWASFQPIEERANMAQGFRARGIGWYRRALRIEAADRGKTLELQFDGIATNATIWINDSVVAHSWSGYQSLYVDLTPFARYGDEINTIAIRVDADAMEGWWYEGAGLYRHVWLARRAPVSIATDGIHCDPRAAADGRWHVPVAVTLASIERAGVAVRLEAVLLDADGRRLAAAGVDATVATLAAATAALTLDAGTPQRWSVERPTLHTVEVRLLRDGVVVDERRVAIGFRTIRFDADRGFFLNDVAMKLKGVCIHQDHAGVGCALPDALIEWRLQRLKAMGCNAIRSSHNAPTAVLLELCDRMGFLVMDENRNFDPAPDNLAQLEWLVRRDRNHPSVILWSVFNEEPMQGTEAGVEMVRRMAAAVRRLDDSRPVTAAMNGSFFEPVNVSSVVDVTGFNYFQGDYDRFHALHPTRPMTSSEDTSAFETRGAYASDPARDVITSYDTEAAKWGELHRAAWQAIVARPFVAGTFVWTGFDYHGEPTPKEWPVASSYFGIMDLCGFPKTAFSIHRAHWVDDRAVVDIAPHWTWPGREGQPIAVFVTSNAERVVLRLDGRTLGEQAVDRIMGNEWHVPYAPGRIEAIAYAGGREVARAVHDTAGPPVALRLTPARTMMAGDGEDVQPVTVDAIDALGRHVPIANLPTRTGVEGGAIIGNGNGDPTSHEAEKGGDRTLFNGLAQVIVQAAVGGGAMTLRATAPGLRPATLTIRRVPTRRHAQEPVVVAPMAIAGWRRSKGLTTRPAPTLAPATGDDDSWDFVRGSGTVADGAAWQLYRADIVLRRRVARAGGTLRLPAVVGKAELWIDGRRVATKSAAAPGPVTARIMPGVAARAIVLIVEADGATPVGIAARATIAIDETA